MDAIMLQEKAEGRLRSPKPTGDNVGHEEAHMSTSSELSNNNLERFRAGEDGPRGKPLGLQEVNHINFTQTMTRLYLSAG